MKPARQSTPKARGCRGCPCRAPSGRCLDTRIKSGRCGDWVWYVRRSKRFRRLYVKPQDPRTRKQLRWRAHFGAASTKYSDSLTQAQRDVRIIAGAKFRSRRRLAQSGPLTGQQYSIRVEYAANAAARAQSAATVTKALQTQGILLSTSDIHRSITGYCPSVHGTGKQDGRRLDKWGMPPAQGRGHFGSGSTAKGSAIQMGAPPEYYPGSAMAGGPQPAHFPSLRLGERPREPKALPTSPKQVLPMTQGIPGFGGLA